MSETSTAPATTLKAVLWDLDGTLIDSEPLWMQAEHRMAAEHDTEWTEEDAMALVGNALIVSGEYIRQRLGSELSAAEIVDVLVEHMVDSLGQDVPWRPGALELVTALDEAGVPQALVTSSYASIASVVAAHLPLASVVAGDTVTHPKPHPEPYATAAAALGVDPTECLAVEDSNTGARSAEAAGCVVLVVPHMVPVEASVRRVERPSLTGLGVADLVALHDQVSGSGS
ncbi:hydrolase [Aeromicrobium sp. Root495]|uniref:HAD family hydrolase n=1 Tax=Aeromicrobium sp. Root495 TaxID=1736550 RepID=UPI0006F38A42|nr:HAD family phosphatase [Aeromicrobium sp. Root495]KQY59294.1 hydrolase [Aeromicrobium sp. Root495]